MAAEEFTDLDHLLQLLGIQYDADAEEITDRAGQSLDWHDVMAAAAHLSLDDVESYRTWKERR